jgi:hypothetical protein
MKLSKSTSLETAAESSPVARYRNLLLIALAANTPLAYSACSSSDESPPIQTQADAGNPEGGQDAGSEDAGVEDSGMDADAEPDPCDEVDCNGHGTCTDGSCECDPGYANDDSDPTDDCDSCDTGYQGYPNCGVIPPPEITNLAIDCSGGPVPGSCAAGGFPYPVDFNATDATSCNATPEVIFGSSSAEGSTSLVNLIGTDGSFDYTTGLSGGIVRITVDCNGIGGFDTDFIELEQQ